MNEDNVVTFRQPAEIDDALTEVLRAGARRLLARAVDAEVAAFLAEHSPLKLDDGRQRVVRHGHAPERMMRTGIGAVTVAPPRVRDRGAAVDGRIRFTSAILPRWARRTKSLDALLPVLYLRGLSSGDFRDALTALLGKEADALSPSMIARLKAEWAEDLARWERRDLSARGYVYLWADGVYLQARQDADAQCVLVLIGATPEGRKELVGFTDGYRESAQSWRVDLKARGLAVEPELAIADGALGFWAALREVFGRTRAQRCWVHKTANVLNKMAN
jgi:transposase-like protein